jgi:hypothetical protein
MNPYDCQQSCYGRLGFSGPESRRNGCLHWQCLEWGVNSSWVANVFGATSSTTTSNSNSVRRTRRKFRIESLCDGVKGRQAMRHPKSSPCTPWLH